MGESMSKRLKLQLGGEAEMEERAFSNPYPDYQLHGAAAAASSSPSEAAETQRDPAPSPGGEETESRPFGPDGKISSQFTRRIQSKIRDLLQQMEEGLKTADPHDCSAYTGWTGIALLYLQLYRVTRDQKYLQRSLDYVKRILRNLTGRRVTFLCGDAGPLAVGAVVYHKLKIDSESKECITKLLQLQRTVISTDSELPDELLYGRAGYLYALLYLNTEIGPDTVPQSVIKEVVDAIIESGKNFSKEERKTERCPLLYQWHRKQYIGAAHGVAGIYYMLMQPVSDVDQETLTELVKPSIDYVRHKKFRSGNYPSSLSNETDRLVHWCHGAPGVIHMLMQAYKTGHLPGLGTIISPGTALTPAQVVARRFFMIAPPLFSSTPLYVFCIRQESVLSLSGFPLPPSQWKNIRLKMDSGSGDMISCHCKTSLPICQHTHIQKDLQVKQSHLQTIVLVNGSHQDSKPPLMAHTLHNYNRPSELYFIFLVSDTRVVHLYK
ncbi:lanC-like protein 2 isoform X1 [Gopherus flavomarginatus]|uniref:lanC-like protein 2 isoform X1 n=1 Tax=Gopherus flavomarginatus TaxID=286002 RepID=UPI0021CBAD24|nr:lanC-like protein 2 isoform X1 [Gopherus flavomarginatus]